MYKIKLNRKNHTVKVSHVNRKVNVKHVTHKVTLKHVGARGPQGIPGPQGEAGVGLPTGGTTNEVLAKASGEDFDFKWLTPDFQFDTDKNYVENFTVTDTVVVNHNLNKYCAVSIIDSAGDEVVGQVEYPSTNQVIVRFVAPFSGTVTCN